MSEQNNGGVDIGLNMNDAEALAEKIRKPAQDKLNKFNKYAAGRAYGWFKIALRTASEPFFRKNMGDRYYSAESFSNGFMLWGFGTIIQCFILSLRFHDSPWLSYLAVISGVGMCVANFYLGGQSVRFMVQIRNSGEIYHSMSRGKPWLQRDNYTIGVCIVIVLAFTNQVVCALFIAALAMNSKLRAEQQAAIYSRYLDSLDQKAEEEYLEDALLDKCPVELTYLSEPLPTKYNSSVRENIAAAVVGKPVKNVAMRPRTIAPSLAPGHFSPDEPKEPPTLPPTPAPDVPEPTARTPRKVASPPKRKSRTPPIPPPV